MFFVPGFLIAAMTFPGVMVHEFAHQLFCRLFRIPVYEVVYFQLSNPSGYVSHEPVEDPFSCFFISIGPFIINTMLGMLLTLPAAVEFLQFNSYGNPLTLLLGWLGLSVLMHAFPSIGDAKVMVNSILKKPQVPLAMKIITAPFIGLIYLGAIGSVVWLDFVYAIMVAGFLPNMLFRLL